MNWLAHVFLSENNIDFQLGNFLADPLKGRAWDGANENIIRGMKTHIKIDSFTDSHEIVSVSKNRLRKKGFLKPVVIDLTYDYLLTKKWDMFSSIPKNTFLKSFNTSAINQTKQYPRKVTDIVTNLVEQDRLNKYRNLDHLKKAFERIDNRLSPELLSKESTISYFERVCEIESDLETDFLKFFPQLCEHIKPHLDKKQINHWII